MKLTPTLASLPLRSSPTLSAGVSSSLASGPVVATSARTTGSSRSTVGGVGGRATATAGVGAGFAPSAAATDVSTRWATTAAGPSSPPSTGLGMGVGLGAWVRRFGLRRRTRWPRNRAWMRVAAASRRPLLAPSPPALPRPPRRALRGRRLCLRLCFRLKPRWMLRAASIRSRCAARARAPRWMRAAAWRRCMASTLAWRTACASRSRRPRPRTRRWMRRAAACSSWLMAREVSATFCCRGWLGCCCFFCLRRRAPGPKRLRVVWPRYRAWILAAAAARASRAARSLLEACLDGDCGPGCCCCCCCFCGRR